MNIFSVFGRVLNLFLSVLLIFLAATTHGSGLEVLLCLAVSAINFWAATL